MRSGGRLALKIYLADSLRFADLSGSDLSGSDLSGVSLRIVNGRQSKSKGFPWQAAVINLKDKARRTISRSKNVHK